jgi:hypothetical protein
VIAGDESADGQSSTLHSTICSRSTAGVCGAHRILTEHVAHLQSELDRPQASETIRRFAGEFLRPHGIRPPCGGRPRRCDRAGDVVGPAAQTEPERVVIDAGPEAGQAPTSEVASDGVLVPLTHRGEYQYELRVHTSPRSARDSYRLENGALHWLRRDVAIGDVVYDIDSGDGAYAMLAANTTAPSSWHSSPGMRRSRRCATTCTRTAATGR